MGFFKNKKLLKKEDRAPKWIVLEGIVLGEGRQWGRFGMQNGVTRLGKPIENKPPNVTPHKAVTIRKKLSERLSKKLSERLSKKLLAPHWYRIGTALVPYWYRTSGITSVHLYRIHLDMASLKDSA